jgi:uncharacterized protein (DUF58 family)
VLTTAGIVVAAVGVALLVAGRLLATVELLVLGAALVAVVLVALAWVHLVTLRLEVRRAISPHKVRAGGATRIEVSVGNRAPATSPVLRLTDPVGGTRGASLQLAPLQRGERARAAYRLPTGRRGLVRVGPLSIHVGDPLGLASLTRRGAPAVDVTVLPDVLTVAAPPRSGQADPHAGRSHVAARTRQGEDFAALRPYVVGDDLRRVHWPSTARNDELMVRQDDVPWQGRTTIVLDVRANAHRDVEVATSHAGAGEQPQDDDGPTVIATLDTAASVAASVAQAVVRRHDLVRVVSTDGRDAGLGGGVAHLDAIEEYLATVAASAEGSLRGVLDRLGRGAVGGGGALVVVLGRTGSTELEALGRVAGRFSPVIAVVCDPASVAVRPPSGVRLVPAADLAGFGHAWATVATSGGGSR